MVMTWQLVRAAMWRPGRRPLHAHSPPAGNRPRLVWILFDELAYKPTFESRDPSLNFRISTACAAKARSIPSDAHRLPDHSVVPSLQLGRVVTKPFTHRTTATWCGRGFPSLGGLRCERLALRHGEAARGDNFDHRMVYHLLPGLRGHGTECYWSNDDAQDRGPTSLDASFAENVWFPLRILAEQFIAPAGRGLTRRTGNPRATLRP